VVWLKSGKEIFILATRLPLSIHLPLRALTQRLAGPVRDINVGGCRISFFWHYSERSKYVQDKEGSYPAYRTCVLAPSAESCAAPENPLAAVPSPMVPVTGQDGTDGAGSGPVRLGIWL